MESRQQILIEVLETDTPSIEIVDEGTQGGVGSRETHLAKEWQAGGRVIMALWEASMVRRGRTGETGALGSFSFRSGYGVLKLVGASKVVLQSSSFITGEADRKRAIPTGLPWGATTHAGLWR